MNLKYCVSEYPTQDIFQRSKLSVLFNMFLINVSQRSY